MEQQPKRGPAGLTPHARRGADGLREDLLSIRHELFTGRIEVYQRLAGMLIMLLADAGGSELLQRFERAWRSRLFPTSYERPLLLLAALRADALQDGPRHPLYAALAAEPPDADAITHEAVQAALAPERVGIWSGLSGRRVQTNDPSRAVAWLWPAFLAGCDAGARPLALVDIGAGAGLNLIADQLPSVWTERGSNKPVACVSRIHAVARLGFDTRPLQVDNEDDVHWMKACIWPGDTQRLARFTAAVELMRSLRATPGAPVLERLTASSVPARLLALSGRVPERTMVIASQMLVWGYLEPTERENYRLGMVQFLESARPGSALWVELEVDDARRRLPATITAHLRVGSVVQSLRLARASQHPTELEIDDSAVAELKARCRSS